MREYAAGTKKPLNYRERSGRYVGKRFLGAGDRGYGPSREAAMQLQRGIWLIGRREAA